MMRGLFQRVRHAARANAHSHDATLLGKQSVAVRLQDGAVVPAGATGVVFDGAGRIRRAGGGTRIALAEGEAALCFHPGPYRIAITPFAAAPEIGLSVSFAVDAPDPRVAQQRFDLYLASEAQADTGTAGELALATLAGRIEAALQRELAQGNLELGPCTSLEEWNAFRSGLNKLLYTRFGVTVDDCLPVDLGETVDYADILRGRAAAVVAVDTEPVATAAPALDAGAADRQSLRRLYLELPSVMCAVRLVTPAPGAFCQQRGLLQRLDLASVQINSMPALELAAPGRLLAHAEQQRRARASVRAAATLDEAWAWLARVQDDCSASLFDELDRIAANLEQGVAERRALREDAA